jgi:hypothetical protein
MMGTGGKGVGSAWGESHCRNGRAEVRTLDAMPQQRGSSAREAMLPEPSGESRLIQLSAGEGEN